MAIVIRYMCCLVFISRSSDLIQYGGIVTKANSCDVHSIETRRPLLSFYTDSANARGTCKYSVTCSVYNGSSPVAARSRLMSTARGDVTTYAIARSH